MLQEPRIVMSFMGILIATLIFAQAVQCMPSSADETIEERKKENCEQRRMSAIIKHPDCSGTLITKVNYCTGSCFSYIVHSEKEPYTESGFRCCAATRIKIKRRRLNFPGCPLADGTRGFALKTIYFPYIEACVCTAPMYIPISQRYLRLPGAA